MVNHHNVWLDRATVCARHAQEWNGPTDFIFHIQIKLFSKPPSRLQCAVPDCATFIQLDRCSGQQQVLQHALRPERQRFANATIDIASTHMTERIIISKHSRVSGLHNNSLRFQFNAVALRSRPWSIQFETFFRFVTNRSKDSHILLHLFIRSAISFNVSLCTNERSASEMMNFGTRRRRLAEKDFCAAIDGDKAGWDETKPTKTVHRKKKKKTFIDACRSELKNFGRDFQKLLKNSSKKFASMKISPKTDFVVIAKVCRELSLPKMARNWKVSSICPQQEESKMNFLLKFFIRRKKRAILSRRQ